MLSAGKKLMFGIHHPVSYHVIITRKSAFYVILSNLKSFHQKAPLTTALKLSVNLCE